MRVRVRVRVRARVRARVRGTCDSMIILPIGEAYLPTRAACAACTLSRFCAAWLGLDG